jgi:hypothetical protein
MNKKTSSKSQYYREIVNFDEIEYHSQLGTGYDLANLGDYSELVKQLKKFDIERPSVDVHLVNTTCEYFMKFIPDDLFTLDPLEAFKIMNKKSAVGFGGKKQGIHSREDPRMFDYLVDYLKGHFRCIINGSQKDELRVFGKIPRLFMSYPAEHTFQATICLYSFANSFYSQPFSVSGMVSAIGDSPQKGCMKVYQKALEQRKYLYATDTSAQDSSVSPDFIRIVYQFIKKKIVLDEVTNFWFENVVNNSINKLVSLNGSLFNVCGGLGSGDYLTTIINIMWRLFMVFENYKYDLSKFWDHNTVIINGDDLVMSSDYVLDLNSKHAKIEWAGTPVTIKELDFCSLKFAPYVHHDYDKAMSVLCKRKRKQYHGDDVAEMQRLGGLLLMCVNKQFYDEIERRMKLLCTSEKLTTIYFDLWQPYCDVYYNYNLDYPEQL